MKKLFTFFSFLFAYYAAAQNTTSVYATITDPSGNVWTNATVTARFSPAPGNNGPYTWTGGILNTNPAPTTTDSSGYFAITLPTNAGGSIVPSGSQWIFTICGNVTLPCMVIPQALTGGSLNLYSVILQNFPGGNVNGLFVPKVYNTTQFGTLPLNQGAFAYNSTLAAFQGWNGSTWLTFGGSIDTSNFAKLNQSNTFTGSPQVAPVWNASSGFQFAGAAAVNHVLLGNGIYYVDSATIPYTVLNGTPPNPFAGTGVPCATSTTVSTVCTSSQIATALNTSPSTLLTPTILPVATNTSFGIVKPDNTTITIVGGVISAVSSSSSPFVPTITAATGFTAVGGNCYLASGHDTAFYVSCTGGTSNYGSVGGISYLFTTTFGGTYTTPQYCIFQPASFLYPMPLVSTSPPSTTTAVLSFENVIAAGTNYTFVGMCKQ